MADAIDHAAEYVSGWVQRYGADDLVKPDFPWIGMMIGMFRHLADRGFTCERRE